MRVFLHTKSPEVASWEKNEFREFARIPVAGEYVTLHEKSDPYKVILVIHTPFPCDCDAEVYAVKVDHMKVQKEALDKTV
jgi:hypothetical protein